MFGPRLAGGHVLLRPAQPGDAEARRALGRHAEIARLFGAAHPRSGEMSSAAAARWIEELAKPGVVAWIVENDHRLLGSARLHRFDGGVARYAVGLLDPDRLGQGLGAETTRLVLGHAFGQLGLERVEAAVLVINERARRCLVRCGFRTTGLVREAAVIEGTPHDELLMEVAGPPRPGTRGTIGSGRRR